MKIANLVLIITTVLINVSCTKNVKSYMIGYWALDSISYKGNNYMDSMLIKQLSIPDNSQIMFPISTKYRMNYDESKSSYDNYFTDFSDNILKVCFNSTIYEFNGEHQLEFRNDTLRHYFLMIIKSKNLYIRAIRLNFIYDSPSGLNIVEPFDVWP